MFGITASFGKDRLVEFVYWHVLGFGVRLGVVIVLFGVADDSVTFDTWRLQHTHSPLTFTHSLTRLSLRRVLHNVVQVVWSLKFVVFHDYVH